MTIKMFAYLNQNYLSKTIASYFHVKKLTGFKLLAVLHPVQSFGFACASYEATTNTIRVDSCMWGISTEYEQYESLVHEMIHMYQHHYGLCEIDYNEAYENRPQEIHAELHTTEILKLLNIIPTESLFEVEGC